MRGGKLIPVAGLAWVCALGWAVLIPSLPLPTSVLHAVAGDDDRRDGRPSGHSDDRSHDHSDDRCHGHSDDHSDDHSRGHPDGHSRDHSDDHCHDHSDDQLDANLKHVLEAAEFTGKIESTLEARLGRRVNPQLANLGRLLWFDKVHSLGRDNTCAGCHSPTNGFGDTQSIAIGVQNNNKVGPHRSGPRNQRRSPLIVNTAFLRSLMWNGRFSAPSRDPFDNSRGFLFPPPEGDVRFPRTIRS